VRERHDRRGAVERCLRPEAETRQLLLQAPEHGLPVILNALDAKPLDVGDGNA